MSTRPIYLPPNERVATAYLGDNLERSLVGCKLTRMVERMPEGGVIGVDGRWGEGKTWLARNWLASFDPDRPAIYIDAFSADFEDDAFATLARAIFAAVSKSKADEGTKKELGKTLLAVGTAISKFGLKISTNLLTAGVGDELAKGLVDAATAGAEAALDQGASSLQAWIQAADAKQQALIKLQKAVETFVTAKFGTLVIVIDELDRCRPDYALRMLDCLKHLFDMPGVVFVLFVNRLQLEAATATRYGTILETGYLDKFVHLWVSLAIPRDQNGQKHLQKFSAQLLGMMERLKLPQSGAVQEFVRTFSGIAYALDMKARDLERASSLVATFVDLGKVASFLFSWMLALKIRHPNIFHGLRNDRVEAHQEAHKLASSIKYRLAGTQLEDPLHVAEQVHEALGMSGRRSREPTSPRPGNYESTEQAAKDFSNMANWLED